MSEKKDKKRFEKGMKVINSHKGKQNVYETYKKLDPAIAEEYVKFLSKQPDAVYIRWDKEKKRFVA